VLAYVDQLMLIIQISQSGYGSCIDQLFVKAVQFMQMTWCCLFRVVGFRDLFMSVINMVQSALDIIFNPSKSQLPVIDFY